MKFKILKKFFLFLVLGGVLFGFGCSRHWHNAPIEKKAEWIVKHLSKDLDLDEKQIQETNKIKDELLKKKEEIKGFRGKMFNELISQVKNEKIDQLKLKALTDEKTARDNEMHKVLIAKFTEFHAILKPEQRVKLAEKMEKFKGKIDRHFW
ncbi:MAG: Spy/CpxP family protein refolding chaperone [Leptospira sp.]|nr:Spy/CpxP family protein refolding chaperone [Leptospira sp.]